MILERALTTYLKWKYARILQLTEFEDLAPPSPVPGREYLVYIHIPFCEELCPYCSFNRVLLNEDLARDYFEALNQEIRIYADLGFQFRSVYVGGGTPTVLPDEIARLLGILRETFPIKEISLETNPNHLTDEIVSILKDGGVNRLSVGVQSFDDSLLQKMARYHKYGSGREIRDRLEKYLGVFDTLNVDMIFNFPGQTLAMLESDLDVIKELEADQATFYPLMVSDATRKELADTFGPISYRQEQVLYNRIVEKLEGAYEAGTAWCFSRRKSMIDEYVVDYDEYAGLGSGSFGFLNGAILSDTFSIPDYIEALRHGTLPLQAKKNFSEREQIQYDFMMKLFGTALDVAEAEKKHGGTFLRSLRKEIAFFRSVGALVSDNGVLRLTRKGQYLWVIMMREFFTGVNNVRDICRDRVDAATRVGK
jgi:coproporphyrinogen III oxidase-like Fe-S oxidoreductase